MGTLRAPSAPRKPRLVRRPTGRVGLTLRITTNGRTDRYTLSAVPIDDPATFGVLRAFRLRRLGRRPGQALEAIYDVTEHIDGGMSCDCPAQTWDHQGNAIAPHCKHISAIVRLQTAGILARGRIL